MDKTRLTGAAGALTAVGLIVVSTLVQVEALRTKAYRDSVGIWTICVGDTENVKPGDQATVDECMKRLARRLPAYEGPMRACLDRPDDLAVKVYAALLVFTYNVGTGAACGSGVFRLVNEGRLRDACGAALLAWNRGGRPKRIIPGLTNRRKIEQRLCFDGIDGK